MTKKIRVTSQKTLLKAKFMEIKEEHLEIGGQKITYHNAYRSPAVMVFPLTDSYDIYLISQYRYLYKKRVFEAVAGYMEKGESTLAAAKRELLEEIGLNATQWEEFFRTELAASVVKATMHLFIAKGFEFTEHNREVGEDIELFKMTLDEAVQKVVNGEIGDAASSVGILLLDKLRREKKI